jgi:hypothetical protein
MILGGVWFHTLVIAALLIPLQPPPDIVMKVDGGEMVSEKTARSNKKPPVKLVKAKKICNGHTNEGFAGENGDARHAHEQSSTDGHTEKADSNQSNSAVTPNVQCSADNASPETPNGEPVSSEQSNTTEDVVQAEEKQSPKRNAIFQGIISYIKFLRTPHLFTLMVSAFFGSFGYYNQFFLIPPLATEIGMSKVMAANLMAIVSVTELVSRICVGVVADKVGRKKVWITAVSMAFSFIVGIIVIIGITPDLLIVYAPLFGLFGGMFTPLIIPLTIDLVAPDMIGSATGLFPLITGGGISVGMPMLGQLCSLMLLNCCLNNQIILLQELCMRLRHLISKDF